MKFHATIQLHFKAKDVQEASELLQEIRKEINSHLYVEVCHTGFSEEKEEDGKSDH